MGVVQDGDNRLQMQELFVFIAERFGIRNFVETGTYLGQTARFAADHFERVVTIEGSESLYRKARRQLQSFSHVDCLCGDSRTQLPGILPNLVGPGLFWLDAHWSGGETFGEQAECPLLEELTAIYANSVESVVLIDDARFFISLPPLPHHIESWPTIFQIADLVRQRAPHTWMTVYADALVLAPEWAAPPLMTFLREPKGLASPRPPRPRRAEWWSWGRGTRRSA